MAEPTVGEVMTHDPLAVSSKTSVAEAARLMRDHDVGDVVIAEADDGPSGVLTDRDIVTRVVAENQSPDDTTVSAVSSRQVTTVEPTASAGEAVQLMRDHAIRRLPVVDGDTLVGIVSIGDLAVHLDPESALADVSAASPSQ